MQQRNPQQRGVIFLSTQIPNLANTKDAGGRKAAMLGSLVARGGIFYWEVSDVKI
jgi:hypothetical protein